MYSGCVKRSLPELTNSSRNACIEPFIWTKLWSSNSMHLCFSPWCCYTQSLYLVHRGYIALVIHDNSSMAALTTDINRHCSGGSASWTWSKVQENPLGRNSPMHGTVSCLLKPLPVASTQNPEANFKMLPEVARSNLPGRPLLQIKMQAVLLAENLQARWRSLFSRTRLNPHQTKSTNHQTNNQNKKQLKIALWQLSKNYLPHASHHIPSR